MRNEEKTRMNRLRERNNSRKRKMSQADNNVFKKSRPASTSLTAPL